MAARGYEFFLLVLKVSPTIDIHVSGHMHSKYE